MKKKIFAAAASVFAAAVLLDLLLSWRGLTTTFYEIPSEKVSARIVLLADIHGNRFGEKNERLVGKIRKAKPDMIAIAGDMLNDSDENTDSAAELISELSVIAPVYISYGNHEEHHPHRADLYDRFTNAGAKVFDFTYEDMELNGTPVRVGGLFGYALPEDNEAAKKGESNFLRDFQDTDRYKILLTHMPYAWTEQGSLDAWDIDLVLSGHLHGGQIIFPFAGGFYAPDQGFFPGKVWGMSESKDGKRRLIISRGLGSSVRWLPRFHNIPEIAVVEIGKDNL